VEKNRKSMGGDEYYHSSNFSSDSSHHATDTLSLICDLRESDVPYAMRASIDLDLRVGAWFVVTPSSVRYRE